LNENIYFVVIAFYRYLRIRQQTAYNGNQGAQGGQNQGPPPQIVLPAQGKHQITLFLENLIFNEK
jgi:hypothetical protein